MEVRFYFITSQQLWAKIGYLREGVDRYWVIIFEVFSVSLFSTITPIVIFQISIFLHFTNICTVGSQIIVIGYWEGLVGWLKIRHPLFYKRLCFYYNLL